jgi:protein-tyrosine phosphatase
MAEVLDWRRVGRPEAVTRFAVSSLRQGAVIAFPTETTYLAAACGLRAEAVRRLQALSPDRPLELAVTGPAQARDWLPELGEVGRRLARRSWPGPLLLISAEGAGAGLAGRLPAEVRTALSPAGALHLRQPAHELFSDVQRRAGVPLVGAALEAVTLRQAVESAGPAIDLAIDDAPCQFRQPATAVEVRGADWRIVREGAISAEQLRQQLARVLVFICTGNTCRSPLAEVICKKLLGERLGCRPDELPVRGWLVLSAGLAAGAGMPAADEAVAVAEALGADLTAHQSRPLWPDLVARADYLVAMTPDHVRAILAHYPAGAVRPRLLDPAGSAVADPIGQPREVYEECARQLTAHIERLLAEVVPAG